MTDTLANLNPHRVSRTKELFEKRRAEEAARQRAREGAADDKGFPDPADIRFPRAAVQALEVGQSFFLPLTGRDRRLMQCRLLNAAKRVYRDVASKAVVEDGVAGLRVWRIL